MRSLVYFSMIFLCLSLHAEAQESPAQLELVKAIEGQRKTYQSLPPKWQVAVSQQREIERSFSRSRENVSACKKSIWSGVFKDTFQSLDLRLKELENARKAAEKLRISSEVVLSNQNVKLKLLNARFAGKARDVDYWSGVSEITATVMSGYYAPMQEVLVSYSDYQGGIRALSTAYNSAGKDCRRGIPKRAFKTLVEKIDILGTVAKVIVDRVT